MTGREIIDRVIHFRNPERIGMSLPDPYPHDLTGAGPELPPEKRGVPWHEVGGGRWEMVDEWGNTWGRLEGITKGEVIRPAIKDWAELDGIAWPDYGNPEYYRRAREVFANESARYRLGWLPGFPFSVARYMRRMEQFLMDIVAEREQADELLGRVEAILAAMIRRYGELGADAVMFCEDWGCQDRLLIHPDQWRDVFGPGFQRLCSVARDSGLAVFMHSCGYIIDIIEDLIEAGIAALQLDQPELMGIDRLADRFGGRVTFWCPVDIQRTLQSRDEAKIAASAERMIRRFGGRGGGFIAGYYGANEAIGLDPKWQDIACRTFVEKGTHALVD